eukprot:6033607-Prymnesium_polylepis.1
MVTLSPVQETRARVRTARAPSALDVLSGLAPPAGPTNTASLQVQGSANAAAVAPRGPKTCPRPQTGPSPESREWGRNADAHSDVVQP